MSSGGCEIGAGVTMPLEVSQYEVRTKIRETAVASLIVGALGPEFRVQ